MHITLQIFAAVTMILGIIQIYYNAWWIGSPAPPFEINDWMLAFDIGWMLASIDLGVRLRRRRLPANLPISFVAFSVFTLAYSSWLAATSGTGQITEAMIPLWYKLLSIAFGAWWVAASIAMVIWARAAGREG